MILFAVIIIRMFPNTLVLTEMRLAVKLDVVFLDFSSSNILAGAHISVKNKWLANWKQHRGGVCIVVTTTEVYCGIFIILSIWKNTPFTVLTLTAKQ